jgi:hypothetical protein
MSSGDYEEFTDREFLRLIKLIEISQRSGSLGSVPSYLDPNVVVLPVSRALVRHDVLADISRGCLVINGWQGDYPLVSDSTYRGDWRLMLRHISGFINSFS